MDDLFSYKPTPQPAKPAPAPVPAAPKALSVTQLLRRMKLMLESQIGEVWIEGEVSNLRKQPSGHWYFSLKDEGAQIFCAIFGAKKRSGSEALEDGAKVRVFAEASVYEARGQLQIIVLKVEHAGAGDLMARFEALKKQLDAEGLFRPERKRPLPAFPRTIGLITSSVGAALQDMLQILTRRAPWVQPVLFPVRVQGKGAEEEIARGIEQMGHPERFGLPRCDVLIVGRGGGSIEDLWCFNEEIVARAIAACPIPIISAVGHEIDFTIADFAADRRAPTPSAAAEIAVPDREELSIRFAQWRTRLKSLLINRLYQIEKTLAASRRSPLSYNGERLLRKYAQDLDSARAELSLAAQRALAEKNDRLSKARATHQAWHPAMVLERRLFFLEKLRARLDQAAEKILHSRETQLVHLRSLVRTLGPESAFQRGFSITLDSMGKAVKSAAALKPGDLLRTRFGDGETTSKVVEE